MKKRDRDWLERQNFHPALENSGSNPFLREHLPAEDIRPLERASIAAGWAYPFGIALLWLGIGVISARPWFQPWFQSPPWFDMLLAWLEVAAGAILLFFGRRGFHRIDAAWRKALQRYEVTTEKAQV